MTLLLTQLEKSFHGLGPAFVLASPLNKEKLFFCFFFFFPFYSGVLAKLGFKSTLREGRQGLFSFFNSWRPLILGEIGEKDISVGVVFQQVVPSPGLPLKGGLLCVLTRVFVNIGKVFAEWVFMWGQFPLCLQPLGVLYSLTSPKSSCKNSLTILGEFFFFFSTRQIFVY